MKFGKIKKFILFGGGNLVLELTKILKAYGFKTIVFSSKRRLNEKIDNSTFQDYLMKSGQKYFESNDINSDNNLINILDEETIGLSAGAPWIFKKPLLNHFKGKLLNMHCRRLPKYRGGGGFSWQIMNNDRLGCSLIHEIESGIDNGQIIKVINFKFPASCVIPEDFEKYQLKKDIVFLKEFIKDIKLNNSFSKIIQNENDSEYWPRLDTKTHGYINWSWHLDSIILFINAFDRPYEGASTLFNGIRVHLKNCRILKDKVFHPFQNGLIYNKTKTDLFVATEQGTLIIGEVVSADSNNIFDKIKIGERLYTPTEYLDRALSTKIVFTPKGKKVSKN